MQLYYTPGVCSLSPHIVLREAGVEFDLAKVDLATKRTTQNEDYRNINTMGYVPALVLDGGEVLTEGTAIVQYIADTNPKSGLAPAAGTIDRALLQAHLNFISAEIHKSFSPLFNPSTDVQKEEARTKVAVRFDRIEEQLSDGRDYLMGSQFSVADAYLFVMSTWTSPTNIDLQRWPHLAAFSKRVAERPKVQEAMRAEGLIQ